MAILVDGERIRAALDTLNDEQGRWFGARADSIESKIEEVCSTLSNVRRVQKLRERMRETPRGAAVLLLRQAVGVLSSAQDDELQAAVRDILKRFDP